MKLLSYFLIICLGAAYVSCSKSTSADPVIPPPVTPVDCDVTVVIPGLLIKTVSPGPGASDSAVNIYDYDKDGLLIRKTVTWYTPGSVPAIKSAGRRYYRDAAGRITRIADKELSDLPTTIDTIYSTVTYQDATGNKVAYVITSYVNNGKTIYDSTAYSYNTDNNLEKTTFYVSGDWPAASPKMQRYETWTYNTTADPIKYEYYQELSTPGVFELIWRFGFEYDDKVNPYYATDDVRRSYEWTMRHNVTVQHVFESVPNDTHDNVITYEYNSDNKPVQSTQTGLYPNTTKYYYSH